MLNGHLGKTEGKVQVYTDDEWHAVCFEPKYRSDEAWDLEAAIVVCRQLGFASGSPVAYDGLPPTGLQVNDVRCSPGNMSGSIKCIESQ